MKTRLKSALKTFNHGEKGLAFPVVLVMLLLVGLMIPPLMSLISTSLASGKTYEDNSYELYAADAGVMDATWLIQSLEIPGKGVINPDYIPTYFGEDGKDTYTYTLPEKVNGQTVSYQIVMDPVNPGDPSGFVVTSTATGTDGSTTTVETRVHYKPAIPPIMVAAGALDGTLHLGGGAGVGETGNWLNIYANGNIIIDGGAAVHGDAYYTDGHTLDIDGSAVFDGTSVMTPPLEFDQEFIPEKPGNIYPVVNPEIDSTQTLGPTCINGDLHITGKAHVTLTGTVWVTGRIVVDAQATVECADGELYFMVSEYSSPFYNAVEIVGGTPDGYDAKVEAILYAPNGDIYIAGTASMNGSVVGRSAEILGSCSLTNPLPFVPIEPPYRPVIITYWKIV